MLKGVISNNSKKYEIIIIKISYFVVKSAHLFFRFL